MSLTALVRRRFVREGWNLGVIAQTAEDIACRGIVSGVRWMPDHGPWRMLADPAYLPAGDGACTVFAEHLDYRIGRGEIWATRICREEDLAAPVLQPWMRSNVHLSYPRPIVAPDGGIYLMVESAEAGGLHIWRKKSDRFECLGLIVPGQILDPTPFHDGERWWLFCSFRNKGPNSHLHLYYADRLEGPWVPHARNPVKVDGTSARPAGPVFVADGQLIRPSQDCSSTYGGAIALNRIVRIDISGFEEAVIRRLGPDPAYPHGLHTLCPAGSVTLVDGKRDAFGLIDVPRKFAQSITARLRPLLRSTLPQSLPLPA